MIRKLVDFALANKFVVLAAGVLLLAWGALSFHNLPVEAYPDIADNYVTVITQWPGRAAEEVEQQVTIPIEIQMSGIPHLSHLRSESIFGLSFVIMIFDDASENDWNRQRVLERLSGVDLPDGLSPSMGTDWSTVGQIYWYTLRSTNPKIDIMELKAIQDWTLTKAFKSVPGVVDASTFGGATREYQVRIDPNKLVSYGMTIGQVEQQLGTNNVNAGGSFIEQGLQQMNVRTIGLMTSVQDIENTLLKTQTGTPLRVKDIAEVTQGEKIRLGQIGKAIHRADGQIIDNADVIYAIVYLRKGADAAPTLVGLHDKVKELNEKVLPPGVRIVNMLDRSDLLRYTTHTVLHNLTEGMILVTILLLFFLGNVRAALTVAFTIPFSLLIASIFLDLAKIPANLLSLGALDFGMVVDGAVVMVENIVRRMGRRQNTDADEPVAETIRSAAQEVQRPVFFAIAIIITAYVPIFTLQRIEGRLFKPMAWTVAFALLGALTFSIVIAPVIASWLFRHGVHEWHNPVMAFVTKVYRRTLRWAIGHHRVILGLGVVTAGLSAFLIFSGVIGSEFLPHLDEGAIWARGALATSTSLSEAKRFNDKARIVFAAFPEVLQVVSQAGRPDDGTDTGGFGNIEFFCELEPKEQWRPVFHENKEALIAAMDREVSKLPGSNWNFSQPIEDNVGETVSGTKGQSAVKVYGPDMPTLDRLGDEIVAAVKGIGGMEDVKLYRVMGQPNLNFTIDRLKAARFGINVVDIQDAIETAVGGKAVTQILEGERRFDLVVRYQEQYRNTKEAIANVRLVTPTGERVSLGDLTKVEVKDGAYDIYREDGSRYLAVTFSVRGRDLGSTVEEASAKVGKQVKLPPGYTIGWIGEYENAVRASKRLRVVLPLTILVIFIILYTMFRSSKWALLILSVVSMAPIGGLLALLITGTNFSVSSGVGFLALFGVSVQTGVIMVEYINQLRARGHSVAESAMEGAVLRLRPVMMTMLVATFGLIPAALSHAIGSDSQRPFAIVIVGGLVAALLIGVIVLPTIYVWIARDNDKLPEISL
jgi:cobalt-zinc-cadmium resistance protein CzcA